MSTTDDIVNLEKGSMADAAGLEVSEDLICSRPLEAPTVTTTDLDGALDTPLKILENFTECGGRVWPAGVVLARYLLRRHADGLQEKTMSVSMQNDDR